VSTWIDVSPEVAFAYVADMTRHREWAVHEIEVTPVDPGAVHVGSRFTSRGRQGNRWWPSELEVTLYEPPHRFGFSATGGPLGTEPGRLHRHEFVFTAGKGGTDFELRRTDPILATGLRFRVIRLLGPIFNRFVRGIRIQTVDNLKRRLEEQRGVRG
jgi:Polyketide cyclase / dehydrase and lipid transport